MNDADWTINGELSDDAIDALAALLLSIADDVESNELNEVDRSAATGGGDP